MISMACISDSASVNKCLVSWSAQEYTRAIENNVIRIDKGFITDAAPIIWLC